MSTSKSESSTVSTLVGSSCQRERNIQIGCSGENSEYPSHSEDNDDETQPVPTGEISLFSPSDGECGKKSTTTVIQLNNTYAPAEENERTENESSVRLNGEQLRKHTEMLKSRQIPITDKKQHLSLQQRRAFYSIASRQSSSSLNNDKYTKVKDGFGATSSRTHTVEDPGVYRPSTPILNWEGPKRSLKPPRLYLWVFLSVLCTAELLLIGVAPHTLESDNLWIFLGIVIPICGFFNGFLMYMSMTRHLKRISTLLDSINSPMDMDKVVQRLQNSRFSRFEETWTAQVGVIKMFCRLLKYHHGVNPVSGKFQCDTSFGFKGLDQLEFDMEENAGRRRDKGMNAMRSKITSTPSDVMNGSFQPTKEGMTNGCGYDDVSVTMYSCQDDEVRSVGSLTINADPLNDNSKTWSEVVGEPMIQKSLILQILKQIKPGMELSKMPLPVDVLEPRSLLEKFSDMFTHPKIFGEIGTSSHSSLERVLAVVRWYLSAYRLKPKGVKKPYNPLLGETFVCYFAKDTEDELRYLCEQVSHHPPVSVFTVHHKTSGITLTAGFYPKPKMVSPNYCGTAADGRIEICIPEAKETWVLGFPNAYAGGLITGPMYLDLCGTVNITCSTSDYSAVINFEPRAWFKNDHDLIRGIIKRKNDNSVVYSIGGMWSGETMFVGGNVKHTDVCSAPSAQVLFQPSMQEPLRPHVESKSYICRPSRAVWKDVTLALAAKDVIAAQDAKLKLESNQRERQKAREARGDEYFPFFFRLVAEKKSPKEDRWTYIGPDFY